MFEALVSLALIALVLAVGVAAARPPSPALQAKAAIARLNNAAAQARFEAIAANRSVVWQPEVLPCSEDDLAGEVTFFADGTAQGTVICVQELEYIVHPLTGILRELTNE